MNARSLLLSSDGRLRALWRILVFALVFAATFVLVSSVGSYIFADVRPPYRAILDMSGFAASALLAHWVCLRWLEGRGWDFVLLGRSSASARSVVGGAMIGALVIGIPSALLLVTGNLDAVPAREGSSARAGILAAAFFLPAAAWEELLVRGYVFAVLREAWGWRWAIISTSVVFGLLHMGNPSVDAQSILIVVFAGMFLGALTVATASLYAAIMAHFAWNWTLSAAFHSDVSGLSHPMPDYRVVDSGPDWLTGGAWGPEGGLATAAALTIAFSYLLARLMRRTET